MSVSSMLYYSRGGEPAERKVRGELGGIIRTDKSEKLHWAKPTTRRLFHCPQNALKLTYRNVEIQKENPRTPPA